VNEGTIKNASWLTKASIVFTAWHDPAARTLNVDLLASGLKIGNTIDLSLRRTRSWSRPNPPAGAKTTARTGEIDSNINSIYFARAGARR